MTTKRFEPEVDELGKFLSVFNSESDRSAALVAAAMLDDRLLDILSAFLVEGSTSRDLVTGFNAPLGTFSR
jgi:mannitol operon repressor